MPTIQQLVRKGREVIEEQSKSRAPTVAYKTGDIFDLQLVNNLKAANPLTWYYDSEKLPEDISSITLTSGQHTIRAVAKIGSVTHNIYQVINVQ